MANEKQNLIQIGRPRPKHKHAEAFCLMRYASQDGAVQEILWNSRDGVTPLTILSKDGATDLYHVDWKGDLYLPNHQPTIGQRVFVDCQEDHVRIGLKNRLDEFWDHPEYPMKDHWGTKDEAYNELLIDWVGDDERGRNPWIIVFDGTQKFDRLEGASNAASPEPGMERS